MNRLLTAIRNALTERRRVIVVLSFAICGSVGVSLAFPENQNPAVTSEQDMLLTLEQQAALSQALDPSAPGPNPNGDSDSDGLSNSREASLGTNPKKSDTDADGLNDGLEVNT